MLEDLRLVGYAFQRVSSMPQIGAEKVVYLRHDVDLHLDQVDRMAEVEANLGMIATYYVLLSGPYNLFSLENRRILHKIATMGHEFGLHYDLLTYPQDLLQARTRLDWEVGILAELAGHKVPTISMHQPFTGQPDPFCELDKYVHPHGPRYQQDLLYTSDSCRAWRDENLLACFGPNPPRRLLLLIHPELWLDSSVVDRITYLEQVMMKNICRQSHDYLDREVRHIWQTHPGPIQHDVRQRVKEENC